MRALLVFTICNVALLARRAQQTFVVDSIGFIISKRNDERTRDIIHMVTDGCDMMYQVEVGERVTMTARI